MIHLNNKLRFMYLCRELKINLSFTSKEIQIFKTKYKNKIINIIYFHILNINTNFEKLKFAVYKEINNNIILKNSNMGNEKWYKDKYAEFLKKYSLK